jgi:hypothetical protein
MPHPHHLYWGARAIELFLDTLKPYPQWPKQWTE